MVEEIRYLTKELLVELNKEAIAYRADHTLPPKWVQALPEGMKFPVVQHICNSDDNVCTQLGVSAEGDTALLDIRLRQFNDLPVFLWDTATRH